MPWRGVMRRLGRRLRAVGRWFARTVGTLAALLGDRRVPAHARLGLLLLLAYALSPIDLVPDFIPVLGLLDELLLLPLGLWLVLRTLPAALVAEHRTRARRRPVPRFLARLGLVMVCATWLVLAAALGGLL